MNTPQSHIILLYRTLLASTKTSMLTAFISLVSIPMALSLPRGIAKVTTLSVGLSAALACGTSTKSRYELLDVTTDLNIVERQASIRWYSNTLSGLKRMASEVVKPASKYDDTWLADNLINDPVTYWLNTGANGLPLKHLLIVGGTGDGKSTLIQAFASRLNGWQFRVYDVDGTVDDWQFVVQSQRVYDLAAIESAMTNDLELLERRILQRRDVGKRWTDTPRLTIAEELPALVSSSDTVANWVVSHAKRGRKPLCFIAAIAQNDTVKNLGLEGDANLRDSCFTRIYLGSKARERAQKLGNDVLLTWLDAIPRGRFIVDDKPCEWVVNAYGQTELTSNQIIQPTHSLTDAHRVERNHLTHTANTLPNTPSDFPQRLPTANNTPPSQTVETLQSMGGNGFTSLVTHAKNAVDDARQRGCSDSNIITEVLGFSGRRYAEGKRLLAMLDKAD